MHGFRPDGIESGVGRNSNGAAGCVGSSKSARASRPAEEVEFRMIRRIGRNGEGVTSISGGTISLGAWAAIATVGIEIEVEATSSRPDGVESSIGGDSDGAAGRISGCGSRRGGSPTGESIAGASGLGSANGECM